MITHLAFVAISLPLWWYTLIPADCPFAVGMFTDVYGVRHRVCQYERMQVCAPGVGCVDHWLIMIDDDPRRTRFGESWKA